MLQIKTAPALQQAITSTYIYDAVISIVFVLLMLLAVNLVKYQSSKTDNSGTTRRIWFFVLGAVAMIASLVFDYFVYLRAIAVPAFVGKYLTHMVIAAVTGAAVYFIVGLILVYTARIGSKLQSIFPKKDR